ncbi:protein-serine/threonine phosphatase [Malassezia sp. CBS 17886]|nr:protein-serine/threonine phosphatase [Malassezia sp. CBS 17886]
MSAEALPASAEAGAVPTGGGAPVAPPVVATSAFQAGIATDRNSRWRRTMEDAHAIIPGFGGVQGQGYFGIFDGHAGKFAAEWCRDHFGHILEAEQAAHPATDALEVLSSTYLKVDSTLEEESAKCNAHSGCTAVTSFLQVVAAPDTQRPERVLNTANVGDARAVLCRGGKAIVLTYDHKGSDELEVQRITSKGGFLLNNRVNGVLAVTRSLGDFSMKEFVVGAPFTTRIVLRDEDEFLIIACDGLWDVISDQEAVDQIATVTDSQAAAEQLLRHALDHFSTDNVSVMVVRFAHT